MTALPRQTTTMLLAGLVATLTLAACGGDDDDTSAATATTPTATTTATTPTTKTGTESTPQAETQPQGKPKVIPLKGPKRSLKASGLKVEIDLDHYTDPLRPDVDEAQPGNRLVGVYLKTRASGDYEPSKVGAIAGLETQDGKVYPVRIIAGGNCEGAYFPSAFVLKSKKPREGCVGFEIPKDAVPKDILLGIRSTTTGKGEQATWELPAS